MSLVLAAGGALALPSPAEARPTFTLTTVASGLSMPWDLTWIGGVMLFDERAGHLYSKRDGAAPEKVDIALPTIDARTEGGLLGIVADPGAETNQRFYTCQTVTSATGSSDVRVLRWRLTSDTSAVADLDPNGTSSVVTGIPTLTGHHNGCRLAFGPDGLLYVGTGDAANGTFPQNRQSLGGKVLRVGADGTIPTDNPFYAEGGNARYVWTYGHRNVQGLAFRPGTTELWNAEHGPDVDDEINLDVKGANYGWDPGPRYDQSTPMTNLQKFPEAVPAVWSSGNPTVATSGLTFLTGSAWGRWQGAMAVARLKGTGIQVTSLDPAGREVQTEVLRSTVGYGRVRSVVVGPDQSLYFTTSNGSNDVIAKITPTAVAPAVPAGRNVSSTGVSAVRSGSDLYAFIRTTFDQIQFKRSTDDGHTWPAAWTSTGLTSTSPPSAASSAAGRVDLVTRNTKGRITHFWFENGVEAGSEDLGGDLASATISSLGDGTLDVLGLGDNGELYRRHFDRTWSSGWQSLDGARFSSAAGASVDPRTQQTVVTARGLDGGTFERTLTPTSNGPSWVEVAGALWSARALGDVFGDQPAISVSRGSDGYVILSRGALTMGLEVKATGDPDVVTRPDGTWVLFARSATGALTSYDARPGEYTRRSLGGMIH